MLKGRKGGIFFPDQWIGKGGMTLLPMVHRQKSHLSETPQYIKFTDKTKK
jgi:hypothetical protein